MVKVSQGRRINITYSMILQIYSTSLAKIVHIGWACGLSNTQVYEFPALSSAVSLLARQKQEKKDV